MDEQGTERYVCFHQGKVIVLDYPAELNHSDMVTLASFITDVDGLAHTKMQAHLYRLVRAGLPLSMIDDTVYTHTDVYRWICDKSTTHTA